MNLFFLAFTTTGRSVGAGRETSVVGNKKRTSQEEEEEEKTLGCVLRYMCCVVGHRAGLSQEKFLSLSLQSGCDPRRRLFLSLPALTLSGAGRQRKIFRGRGDQKEIIKKEKKKTDGRTDKDVVSYQT